MFCFSSHKSIFISSFSLVHNILSILGFTPSLEALKLVFTLKPNPKLKGWERELKFTTWKDPNFWEVLILKPWNEGSSKTTLWKSLAKKNQFFSLKITNKIYQNTINLYSSFLHPCFWTFYTLDWLSFSIAFPKSFGFLCGMSHNFFIWPLGRGEWIFFSLHWPA